MRGLRRHLCACFVLFGLLLGMLLSAVPVAAAYYTSWLQYAHPKYSQGQVAWIRLCEDADCAIPRVGVPVHVDWNIHSGIQGQDWQTGTDGKAALIMNQTGVVTDLPQVGETVRVDISFVNGSGRWQNGQPLFFVIEPDDATTAPSYGAPLPDPYSPPPAYPAPSSSIPAFSGPVSGSNGVCPAGYPIKANDNSGIYHVPGGQFYDLTNAYNCFATEAAAQAAGYRKSLV